LKYGRDEAVVAGGKVARHRAPCSLFFSHEELTDCGRR
jgi:hypothetical protein